MSYMLDEIHQQPDVIRNFVKAEKDNIASLAAELKKRDVKYTQFAARGTSDNAATYAKYLFEIINGMPVSLAAPSIFTLYNAQPKFDNSFVVGISQSGKAADVIEYMTNSKKLGALTASITNEAGSEITKDSDFNILCNAGPEKSVAATKTYTSTLAAIYLLSAMMAGKEDMVDSLLATADQIQRVIDTIEPQIAQRAERYRYMDRCFVLARGISRATAFESALKLAETCYVSIEPYSSSDFLHGPIAMVEEGAPVFLYAPEGVAYDSMVEIAKKVDAKGAELVAISSGDEILSLATTAFKMPAGIDELLSPIVYITVGQLFAYYLATAKKHDPDNPRGLSKVTITR